MHKVKVYPTAETETTVFCRGRIESGWPPFAKSLSRTLTPDYKVREDELSVKDNYILTAPLFLRHTLIALALKSHQGLVCTKQRCCNLYWWAQMDSQLQSCIASSVLWDLLCPGPLRPLPLPDGPRKRLGLDIFWCFRGISLPEYRAVYTAEYFYFVVQLHVKCYYMKLTSVSGSLGDLELVHQPQQGVLESNFHHGVHRAQSAKVKITLYEQGLNIKYTVF